jgi:hypothetical protein
MPRSTLVSSSYHVQSPVFFGPGSTLKPTFISNGLKLSRLSSAYLGLSNMARPIFISNRLGYLVQAQHSSGNFSRAPRRSLSILYRSNTYYFDYSTTQNITIVKLYSSLSSPQKDKIYGL